MNSKNTTWKSIVAELAVMLSGTIGVALNIPWLDVLSPTTPGGGDIPAHPVLMASVKDALLNHGSIIHYCYRFWGGFELFQSYFPLPYVVGALLSVLLGMNIAFKLTAVTGLLLTPLAFTYVARAGGLSLTAQFFASVLGVNFLYTEAHTIWGGNVFSTMAGSIGHCWSFPLFLFAYGAAIRSREDLRFTALGAVSGALAIASHFYALLMLFVLNCVFLVVDLWQVALKKQTLRRLVPFYLTALVSVLLMAWWIFPLMAYRAYTSEFGGDWDLTLLKTLRLEEQFVFGAAIAAAVVLQLRPGSRTPLLTAAILFLGAYGALFVFCTYLGSTAFNNVRIWPSFYLALHLLTLAVAGTILQRAKFLAPVFAGVVWLMLPADDAFMKAATWMKWNFEGIEKRIGWKEFSAMTEILNRYPPSRITFEAGVDNNRRLGSGRTFEMLPYFTHHDILEGGIVGSATWPGIAYSIQCLTSISCAGWPPGSIVPTHDIPRAIETMQSYGVEFHITSGEEFAEEFRKSPLTEELFRGKYFSLFRIVGGGKLVEVYPEPAPIVLTQDPNLLLLNQYRFDTLRRALFVFQKAEEIKDDDRSQIVDPKALHNYLETEWLDQRRMVDRGAEPRVKNGIRYLNSFYFAKQRTFNLENELKSGPSLYLGDQTFSPWTVVAPQQEKHSEVALPLLRETPGETTITIFSGGYRAFLNSSEINANGENKILFEIGADGSPDALLTFVPDDHTKYRYIDVFTRDESVRAGFRGSSSIKVQNPITEECKASVDRQFEVLVLHTACPGRPHLVKFMNYPKWQAAVPIRTGSNGFIELTPVRETTELRHVSQPVDTISQLLSAATALLLAGWMLVRLRRHSRGKAP